MAAAPFATTKAATIAQRQQWQQQYQHHISCVTTCELAVSAVIRAIIPQASSNVHQGCRPNRRRGTLYGAAASRNSFTRCDTHIGVNFVCGSQMRHAHLGSCACDACEARAAQMLSGRGGGRGGYGTHYVLPEHQLWPSSISQRTFT